MENRHLGVLHLNQGSLADATSVHFLCGGVSDAGAWSTTEEKEPVGVAQRKEVRQNKWRSADGVKQGWWIRKAMNER
ncbi:unnamed protein product [Lactuca virosa]|uniref:Uncharacterized protein n=1 Tax=Lactuca virosa TaxID=75947 RepID=A0AAU9LM17_9ASTR|nr:unnamed protein product [Lactuca virosa]